MGHGISSGNVETGANVHRGEEGLKGSQADGVVGLGGMLGRGIKTAHTAAEVFREGRPRLR
jgi:hypothetical protein